VTPRYRAISPAGLCTELADLLVAAASPGSALRVAVDGPDCAAPAALAQSLVDPLRARGRPSTVIEASSFWRDAALRLEWGHTDTESFPEWLDAGALAREVLVPLGPGGSGRYLPSLRNPATNRSTREPRRPAASGEIVMVAGSFLLGRGPDFDVTVHLAVSPAARRRQTADEDAWTLPAYDAYDASVRPAETADVAVRYDDPAHPAVRV
jgi:hypothetical protein